MKDEYFMRLAIEQAIQGDWPYGAVLVKDDAVIAKAYNTVIRDQDVTAHAEVNLIRKALRDVSGLSLKQYTLYTSGEPCPMCAGAVIWSGVSRLVFGASIEQLIAAGQPQINMPAQQIINTSNHSQMPCLGGVLAADVIKLVQNWQHKHS